MAEYADIQNTKYLTQLTRTEMFTQQTMVCHFNSFILNLSQLIINRWKNPSNDDWKHHKQDI